MRNKAETCGGQFSKTKGEQRKEVEEEVKKAEEEKGESELNAARKTSNLRSDCWAPSMCCDDSV